MKNQVFKQCYAILVLIAFVVLGWIYLKEHRYINAGSGYFVDTWTQECKPAVEMFNMENNNE